jgi:hypothetical protein
MHNVYEKWSEKDLEDFYINFRMLQFHTKILSAKLSIHEDRHGKLLGGGGKSTEHIRSL